MRWGESLYISAMVVHLLSAKSNHRSYDLNNWSETPESLAMKALLKPEDVLIEGESLIDLPREMTLTSNLFDAGYPDLITHRKTLASYYPSNDATPDTVELDGVGGCTALVRASIHREGAVFPAYAFDNQMETEGFGRMVKRLGGRIVGLPKYYVFHGSSVISLLAPLSLSGLRLINICRDQRIVRISLGQSVGIDRLLIPLPRPAIVSSCLAL